MHSYSSWTSKYHNCTFFKCCNHNLVVQASSPNLTSKTPVHPRKMLKASEDYECEGSSPSSSSVEEDEGISSYLTDDSSEYALTTPSGRTKIFNDMVHPHLELPQLCYYIINTPHFQRLRNLKQLGLCYHVYPSACHNRFEHCIGVSYLAGKYCKSLQSKQPELGINEKDVLCLYIGGLCHDLGHGPFSHLWEIFVQKIYPNYSHEQMSIRLLEDMIQENDLFHLFTGEGLDEQDLLFIKEIILGHPLEGETKFGGRPPSKHFLYQIVANDSTKVDVDKFDYLLRDAKQLNVSTAFDYERVLENSRVFFCTMEGDQVTVQSNPSTSTTTTIAYRKKIGDSLEDLFRGRFSLHQKAYQHKVSKVIEQMVLDGLDAAEGKFKLTSKDGTVHTLSSAHLQPSAFIKLTDSVFERFQWGEAGEEAAALFQSILRRKLYKCLGYVKLGEGNEEGLGQIESIPNVILIRTNISYGKGALHPLNSALFFEKGRPNVLFRQTFSPPTLEKKCYIVLRPQNNNVETTGSEDLERSVRAILKQLCINLETE